MIFSQFAQYPALQYGFSERSAGSMHRRTKKENREKYFTDIGISPDRVVTADLAHGRSVAKVGGKDAGTMIVDTDGLITDTKNLTLSATAADCFLLYFYDPIKKVVGISHAGWRGTLAGVVANSVDTLQKNFGTTPRDLLVGISPGIRECHFEISSSDKEKFTAYAQCIILREGRIFVSLPDILQLQLQEAGVQKEHIEESGSCTYCSTETCFSYRRYHPKEVEVMVGYIGLM